jgi:hypothetical protein
MCEFFGVVVNDRAISRLPLVTVCQLVNRFATESREQTKVIENEKVMKIKQHLLGYRQVELIYRHIVSAITCKVKVLAYSKKPQIRKNKIEEME